jgi:hypothetical protein
LGKDGYCVVRGSYADDFLHDLRDQAERLVKRSYTQQELDRHSVYPSDTGDARVSHAVMISEGISTLPVVEHIDLSAVDSFLRDHHAMLSEITGTQVQSTSRTMLNYQNYFHGSKPVGEHFDGEYLRTTRAADGIEFRLEEGVLPRYVAVLIVANDNAGKGTELVDTERQAVFTPVLNAGDLLVFDNVRLRHRVPTMEQPRTTIGLRSFDHLALHFVRRREDCLDAHYWQIPEGWVSEDVDCQVRLHDFMDHEWPVIRQDYAHYF